MDYGDILYETDGHVGTITLNGPDAHNALSFGINPLGLLTLLRISCR